MEKVVHRFWNVPASLHGPLHCLLLQSPTLFICPPLFSAFAQNKTMIWTVPFPVLLYLTVILCILPGLTQMPALLQSVASAHWAQLIMFPPICSQHFIHTATMAFITFHYAWFWTYCSLLLDCELLKDGDSFMPSCRLLSPQHIVWYSGWPSSKGKCLNNVVATLSLKPRKPLSDLG